MAVRGVRATVLPLALALAAGACGHGAEAPKPERPQAALRTANAAGADDHHAGAAVARASRAEPPPLPPPPPRPAAGDDVPAGEDLQARIAAAPPGAVLRLAPGVYRGPLRIERRLTLWGPPDAVVQSAGEGSTLTVQGEGAVLQGFTIDGSGGRFDNLDAAVRIHDARDVRVEGLVVREALFGILVEQSSDVTLARNRVIGTGQSALGLRGDGIRLWETRNSRVAGNVVSDSRDMVVWYSSDNTVAGNWVGGGRYGTHFMYSHRNTVTDNRYVDNVVGVFVMYSRDIELRRNLLARASGAGGMGLGLKESGNVTAIGNWFVQDEVGLYSDTAPLDLQDHNRFAANLFWLCGTAIAFHSSPARNVFEGNALRDNDRQVVVEGRGDATSIEWRGNEFDDYKGYDLDGDGVGDVAYELRSLAGELTARFPSLAFFRGTPSLQAIDVAGHVMPVFASRLLLSDRRPAMSLALELPDAR